MGGGTVFRGVTRLVGAATVGAAVAPPSGALCHVHPPASISSREQDLAILDDAEKEFCNVNSYDKNVRSFMNVRHEQGESVAEREESSRDATYRHRVFYPPPTEEEVDEATKELQAVLNLSIPAPRLVAEEDLSDSMVGLTMSVDDADGASSSMQKRELAALPSSAQPLNYLGNVTMENSPVMQAFQLLQSNPKVQDVVKSLVSDPVVWNAMLSNEKVLELTQEDSRDSQDSFEDDDDGDYDYDILEMKELGLRLASKFCGLVTRTKAYYSYVRGKLFSVLDTMFGSMEKTLLTKGGASTKDRTVVSCLMLTVAVVIVVVVRRSLQRP